MRSKYISSEDRTIPVDLGYKVQYFTLDVISSVAFSQKFGMLNRDSDIDEYIKSCHQGFYLVRCIIGLGLRRLIQAPVIGKLFAPSHTDQNGLGRMMRATFDAVEQRESNPTDERSDMIASFIRNGIVGADLRSEVLEQIIAGSDTTAAGIRGIILHVATNAQVYAKLQQEIDSTAFPENESGIITLAQARSLTYLQAVIREGLRMFPPATTFLARDVPPGGDDVPLGDGKTVYVPGGTCIGPSIVSFHKDPEIYGPDANIFRPERWFETDPHKLEKMSQVSELMFGYGRFKCLGKPVAQIELNKVIFEVSS